MSRTFLLDLTLRSLVPSDLPAVLQVAKDCPEWKWPRDEFQEALHSPDAFGRVAVSQGDVIGFLVYRLDRSLQQVFLKTLAVAPPWRRRGVGSALLRLLDSYLPGYERIRAILPETSLLLQLLLRSQGFLAVRVLKNWFEEEHAYLMEKSRSPDEEELNRT